MNANENDSNPFEQGSDFFYCWDEGKESQDLRLAICYED